MFFKDKLIFVSRTNSENREEIDKEKQLEERPGPRNSYVGALATNFRSTVGTGILALPIAFSQVGYVGGIVGIIFITAITNYCAAILVGSQRELLRRNDRKDMIPTYQGTMQAAFAEGPKSLRKFSPFFLTFTNIFILIGQVGGICVDIILISSNLKAAVGSNMDLRYFELLLLVPMLAISMIPNMKKMTIVSAFGNTAFFISIGVVLYYVFREPISFEERHPFGSISEVPKYVGTVFFSSVTITLVLTMENEMKRPGMLQGPFGVLNATAYLVALIYVFFGLVGYLKFGDEAADSITLNLPSSNWLSQAVQVLLSCTSFTSVAVNMYIGVNVVWCDYLDKRLTKHRTLAKNLLRIGFVLLTLMISILIPSLQILLSAMGIISQSTLSTTLPCVIHILTYYQQPSLWAYVRMFWLNVVTFLFTIFVLICSYIAVFGSES